jgi:hypothetical protein
MVEARWLRWLGPGLVALGAVGLVGSTTLGAGARTWDAHACDGPPAELTAATDELAMTEVADLQGAPWFRLDPLIDRGGALTGQRLAVGLDGTPGAQALDLSAESFVAGPFGRVVLAGSDDGVMSTLQALDVAGGCSWSIATESNVIRRATIDRSGTGIYEMRVDRATRADLGIWFRPLDGLVPARRILPAPPTDGRFGVTWSTEFSWDLAGDRLAIQSCGEVACRTRIVDPGGGPAATLDSPDLGAIVGLDGHRVVTYEACRGLPCPIVSTDLGTGERLTLMPAAGRAVMVSTADGARLVAEVGLVAGSGLRSVALDGGRSTDLGPIPDGLDLQTSSVQANAATRLPAGWVLLAPDGRLPADGRSDDPRLRHIPDGATVPLAEAIR